MLKYLFIMVRRLVAFFECAYGNLHDYLVIEYDYDYLMPDIQNMIVKTLTSHTQNPRFYKSVIYVSTFLEK